METMVSSDNLYSRTLDALDEAGNLRTLSQAEHQGKWIWKEGKRMLNLSSNDYLGLAADTALRDEFMRTLSERDFLFSSSSSRLLTGNFTVYDACRAIRSKRCTGLFERLSHEYRNTFRRG